MEATAEGSRVRGGGAKAGAADRGALVGSGEVTAG